ncbi:hypothetical protein HDV05_001312 [Chytridiales sp. JEL 0842]|nr:hypothetical protein HDV05_001312 [Chytridiales sp. JEL 0842]
MFLLIGKGWAGQYVADECVQEGIEHVATTTKGGDGTIPFKFDPTSSDKTPFKVLPDAETILITFPLLGAEAVNTFTNFYLETRSVPIPQPRYILFGTTASFNAPNPTQSPWADRFSLDPTANPDRVAAENRLLSLGGCVLSLAGLFDENRRHPRNFIDRVAPSKEVLKGKASVHYIHGQDVARAVVAVLRNFTPGERWLLTNVHVFDWWELASRDWDAKSRVRSQWVRELMVEHGVRGLPRAPQQLGRALDSLEFWTKFQMMPIYSQL